jgi:hypothetical protein
LSAFAGFFNDYSLILLEFCSTGFYFSFWAFSTLLVFLIGAVCSVWAFVTLYFVADLSTLFD